MQFDDRLATVLRMHPGTERAANTQYRQLLDLLGSAPSGADGELLERAYTRLDALSAQIPAARRTGMIREPGTRLRNPELVSFLAGQDSAIAAAAMASARLSETQWADLFPSLPAPARALLRYRDDLPAATAELLAWIGIRDLGLPEPELAAPAEDVLDLEPDLELGAEESAGIGAIVRRIKAFQRARQGAAASAEAPQLPLEERAEERPGKLQAFDFATDAEGRISWADPALAPMTRGIALASRHPGAPARADTQMVEAIRRRQPVRAGHVALDGAPAIAGEWRVDAAPHFAVPGGGFTGYRGRMRRPATAPATRAEPDSASDRMRQVLHELRTPVNAIQGFAEIIHQQLFGPTPNEYRALAAAIAGDAARMLAGFDELDRLAKLEGGALELAEGSADLHAIVAGTVRQLDTVLKPRSAGIELDAPDAPCPVALAQGDAELVAWRILATIAGAASPGEALQVRLAHDGEQATLEADLPASLASREDLFGAEASQQPQSVTSGMFGAGFALRLARAEAHAAGGDLSRKGDVLRLVLPAGTNKTAENDNLPLD